MPLELTATIVENITEAYVAVRLSWTYDSPCRPVTFTLVYVSPDGTNIAEKTNDNYVTIHWAEKCHPILVRLHAQHGKDSGPTLEMTLHLVPALKAPISVEVNPISGESRAFTITWRDDSECRAPKYEVRLYKTQGQVVQKQETDRQDMIINLNNSCESLDVGIVGVNAVGESRESSKVGLFRRMHTGSVTRVITDTERNYPNVLLSWTYDNPCEADLFDIAVYRSAGGMVLQTNSTKKNVLLGGLPKCVGMYAEVVSKDSLGRGPLTQTGEFIIVGVPVAVNGLTAQTEPNRPDVALSWDYNGPCAASTFKVTVYKKDGTNLYSDIYTDKSIVINELPKCVAAYAEVIAQNAAGDGPASKTDEFTILKAPDAPKNLELQVNHGSKQVKVSWSDESECPPTEYTVSLYNELVAVEQHKTAEKTYTFTDVDLKIRWRVGVKARNQHGDGLESMTSQLEAHDTPSDILVQTHRGVPVVEISWTSAALGEDAEFTVTLYRDSVVSQFQRTKKREIRFNDVSMCNTWVAGVVAQTSAGKSKEGFSSEFRIPAIEPPDVPSDFSVHLCSRKRMLYLSWVHSCATGFSVFLYEGGSLMKQIETNQTKITFGNLPSGATLYVGVSAFNGYESSPEIMSAGIKVPL
ncbi:fibronectin type III domain protein, partial [Opisthorchis viverrini]